MSGSGWEDLPDVRKFLGGPLGSLRSTPGCPGVIEMPSRMSGICRESLPDVRKLSGDPPGCP